MKTNKCIFGLIVMPLLSACSSDEPKPQTGENPRIIAKIVDGEETRVNTEGDGGQFLPGDEFVIFSKGTSDSDYSDCNAKYITKLGTQNGVAEFEFSQGDQLMWDNYYLYLYAYSSPCIKSSNASEKYVIYEFNDDQSSVEKLRESDYLLGFGNLFYDIDIDPEKSLSFSHKLTKITMTINEYSNFGELNYATDVPTDVKIYSRFFENINEIPVYYDSYKEYIRNDGSLTDCLRAITPYAQLDSENGEHSFTAIVMPIVYNEGDLLMKFKFKGIEYTVKATGDICSSSYRNGLVGCHYHFTVKLNGKNAATVSSVSLEDWDYDNQTVLQPNEE